MIMDASLVPTAPSKRGTYNTLMATSLSVSLLSDMLSNINLTFNVN